MSVSAPDVTVTYDGQPHGISVAVSDPSDGYTISYFDNGTSVQSSPTIINVNDGPKQVEVQVNAENFSQFVGFPTITIQPAAPTVTAAPTASAVTYGQTLADSTLTGGTAVDINGTTLAGTWVWVDSTASVGNAGSHTFKAKFTPSNAPNYKAVETDVTVTVNKADPTAVAPSATAVYGQTLADVTLTNREGNTAGTWTSTGTCDRWRSQRW